MSYLTKINNEELLNFIKGDEYEGSISYHSIELGVSQELIDFVGDKHIQVEGMFGANRKLYVVYSRIVTPEELQPIKGNNIFANIKLYASSGKYKGVVNGQGKPIIETQYYSIVPFMNDIVKIETKGNKFGLMRLSGEFILEPKYDRIDPLCELVYAVCKDGKLGFMNLKGEVEIPFIYEVTDREVIFSGGLACVLKQNDNGEFKYGYINHKNQEILPFKFVLDTPFKNADVIENWEVYDCGYGKSYTREYYYLSLDGAITHFQTEHFEDDSWRVDHDTRYALDEGHRNDDNDWLDAFEGDPSNRWNVD